MAKKATEASKQRATKARQKKISTAKQWAATKKAEWELTLPSGAVVVVTTVGLIELIHTGQIPNELLPSAVKMFTAPGAMTANDWEQYLNVLRLTACEAVVMPKVVIEEKDEDMDEGVIYVGSIPDEDLVRIQEVTSTIQKEESEKLRPFCSK